MNRKEHIHESSVDSKGNSYKFCPTCWCLKERSNGFKTFFRVLSHSHHHNCCCHKHQDESCAFTFSQYEAIVDKGKLFLNMTLSGLLREKAINCCDFRINNEQFFIVFYSSSCYQNLKFYKCGGVGVRDQELVENIMSALNIGTSQPYHLHISTNRAKLDDTITVQILRAVSHSEYTVNPFVIPESVSTQSSHVNESPAVVGESDNNSSLTPVVTADGLIPEALCSTVGYKLCLCCHRPLPLGSYYMNTQSFDGFNNICKDCSKKDIPTIMEIPSSEIVFFAEHIFFNSEISELFKINGIRHCHVSVFDDTLNIIVNGNKKNRVFDFSYNGYSKTMEISNKKIVDDIAGKLHLDKNTAYRLKVSLTELGNNTFALAVTAINLWNWLPEPENVPVAVEKPVGISSDGSKTETIRTFLHEMQTFEADALYIAIMLLDGTLSIDTLPDEAKDILDLYLNRGYNHPLNFEANRTAFRISKVNCLLKHLACFTDSSSRLAETMIALSNFAIGKQ